MADMKWRLNLDIHLGRFSSVKPIFEDVSQGGTFSLRGEIFSQGGKFSPLAEGEGGKFSPLPFRKETLMRSGYI